MAFLPATFDPGTVTDTALSNGNLTATHTTANANSGARVLPLKSDGKFYFEIKMVLGNGAFDVMGLAAAGVSYNNIAINSPNCVAVSRGGGITINGGGALANIGAFAPNDILGIAVDLTAHLIWCRRNAGTWNNSGTANPATATGGLACPAVALAPCVCFVGSGTAIGDAYTANFGATAYANAAPAGFGTSWPSDVEAPVSVPATSYVGGVSGASRGRMIRKRKKGEDDDIDIDELLKPHAVNVRIGRQGYD